MMSGLASLMDEVATEAPPPGLAAGLRRLTAARRYADIERVRPADGAEQPGMLVFAQPVGGRTVVAIDTGQRLLGAVGSSATLPPVGSAVRLVRAAPGAAPGWTLSLDEALPIPLDVHFDLLPETANERRWIGVLRAAVEEIRTIEALRRDALAARRRDMPRLQPVPTMRELLRRRIDMMGRDAAALRAELPALHERVRMIRATNDLVREELQRIDNAYGESRARTVAMSTALGWLDAFVHAPFVVVAPELPLRELDDPERADDVLRTIVLLARAFPRTQRLIAV